MGARLQTGFSLTELVIVIAVVGVLGTVAAGTYQNFQIKTQQSEAKMYLGDLYSRVDTFRMMNNNKFPEIAVNIQSAPGNGPATVDLMYTDPTTCSSFNVYAQRELAAIGCGNPLDINCIYLPTPNVPTSNCTALGYLGEIPKYYTLQVLSVGPVIVSNPQTDLRFAFFNPVATGGPALPVGADATAGGLFVAAAVSKTLVNGQSDIWRINQNKYLCAPYNVLSGPAQVGNNPGQCAQTWNQTTAAAAQGGTVWDPFQVWPCTSGGVTCTPPFF